VVAFDEEDAVSRNRFPLPLLLPLLMPAAVILTPAAAFGTVMDLLMVQTFAKILAFDSSIIKMRVMWEFAESAQKVMGQ
jgi:hypothetical protein